MTTCTTRSRRNATTSRVIARLVLTALLGPRSGRVDVGSHGMSDAEDAADPGLVELLPEPVEQAAESSWVGSVVVEVHAVRRVTQRGGQIEDGLLHALQAAVA